MTSAAKQPILRLTSPYMKGAAVKRAQSRLNKSRIGDRFPGTIDGEYGPITASSVRRAKFLLGYARANINGVYNLELDQYLRPLTEAGAKPLTPVMRLRRKVRLQRAAAAVNVRARALKIARSHVGIKESPAGSNNVVFSRRYGMNGPWCAMFVTCNYIDAGAKIGFKLGERWAYCPYMYQDALANRNGLSLISSASVEPGDIVLFDWDGNGVYDHVGHFDKWAKRGAEFETVEGNTSVGNDSNGGAVMERYRYNSSVKFLRYTGK